MDKSFTSLFQVVLDSGECFVDAFCDSIETIYKHSKANIITFCTDFSQEQLKALRAHLYDNIKSKLPENSCCNGYELRARKKNRLLAEDIYILGYSLVSKLDESCLKTILKPQHDGKAPQTDIGTNKDISQEIDSVLTPAPVLETSVNDGVTPARRITKPLRVSDFVKSKTSAKRKRSKCVITEDSDDTVAKEKICMPFCKYSGAETENMICYCLCHQWHHYNCVNIKDAEDIPTIWNCPLCRRMPTVVRDLSSRISFLEQTNTEQTLMITELLRIVRKFDNNDEHAELTKICNTGNLRSKTPKSVEKDLPELLLGSSILKETSSKTNNSI